MQQFHQEKMLPFEQILTMDSLHQHVSKLFDWSFAYSSNQNIFSHLKCQSSFYSSRLCRRWGFGLQRGCCSCTKLEFCRIKLLMNFSRRFKVYGIIPNFLRDRSVHFQPTQVVRFTDRVKLLDSRRLPLQSLFTTQPFVTQIMHKLTAQTSRTLI